MKIMANPYAPWRFFTNDQWLWNCFDFLIVALSMPGVIGSQAAALRLLRLARVFKIINKIPRLQVIVVGMVSGLSACGYIMLLMGIVFYIYAVLGVSLYSANDPSHFSSLSIAFESLFRSATLEDWSDIWYTNFCGCRAHDHGLYVPLPAEMTSGSEAYSAHFNENGFHHTSSLVVKAPASRYCEANGFDGSGYCDAANSRCVLLGDAGSAWYGCECIGTKVPDLTAGHIFATDTEGSLFEIAAALTESVHSGSFPYCHLNNFSVGTLTTNSTALMTCVAADEKYPYMPALPDGSYYCEDSAQPVTSVLFFFSFVVVSAFILISLFVGSVLISIMSTGATNRLCY
jgi:hypothetical protein